MHLVHKLPTAAEVQAAIERVRGVTASRVVAENGVISEVHILAEAGRSPKQIVRDVESVCQAQFGLALDHRKISVALIQPSEKERRPVVRPEVRGLRVETGGREIHVHVLMGVGDKTYEGSAQGVGGVRQRYRLAATAALEALHRFLGESCRFELDDLVSFHLGGYDGFLAGVVMISAFGEEQLVGSALVKTDMMDAAIDAALNAVSRRIPSLAGEERPD